jgi:D-glycero-alpha-D-manno-heptose 1-phosphate guanylyltransferase
MPSNLNQIKSAIVLAGGFGTRLSSVVSEVPKPMAPIGAKPFLQYLLDFLQNQQFEQIILSVGHKREVIMDYFGKEYKGMEILYAVEDTPLGTGGGIAKAMTFCTAETVAVLNGDTFFDIDLQLLAQVHSSTQANVTIGLKPMSDFDRYGIVETNSEGKVLHFQEKKPTQHGNINGGVYLVDMNVFLQHTPANQAFSFEKDFLEVNVEQLNFQSLIHDGYFIDIGVPSDYFKAEEDFKYLFSA